MKLNKMILLLIFFTSIVFVKAEEPKRSGYGMAASVGAAQYDLLLPIWISQKTTLAPFVRAIFIENMGSEIGFGLEGKFYLKMNKLAPFISSKVGILGTIPERGKSVKDWVFGIGAGGDYFLDNQFSIGVEFQLNGSKSDTKSSRFGNPGGVNINTASALRATIYF